MELRQALKEQYHAGLAMLAECVEKCPEGMWLEGEHPRTFWRIAFHAAFFTHLYLQVRDEDFVAWEKHRDEVESDQERERLDLIAHLADMCGDDIDGFVAELEDYGLV